MNKTNLLQKFAPLGVAAFGTISVIGITTAPVHAGQLSWTDGTSEFFEDVLFDPSTTPVGTDLDDFSVTFNPGTQVSVFTANGEFNPAFPSIDPSNPQFFTVNPSTGDFTEGVYLGLVAGVPEFEYELEDDLVFDFGNGVEVTYAAGSTFLGEFDLAPDGITIEGVEFELEQSAEGTNVTIGNQEYYEPGDPNFDSDFPLTGLTLTFDEPAGGTFGEYSAGTTVASTVPEPTTILGLLAVSGLGLSLKRKKQS